MSKLIKKEQRCLRCHVNSQFVKPCLICHSPFCSTRCANECRLHKYACFKNKRLTSYIIWKNMSWETEEKFRHVDWCCYVCGCFENIYRFTCWKHRNYSEFSILLYKWLHMLWCFKIVTGRNFPKDIRNYIWLTCV